MQQLGKWLGHRRWKRQEQCEEEDKKKEWGRNEVVDRSVRDERDSDAETLVRDY